jgi:hypothetical protein
MITVQYKFDLHIMSFTFALQNNLIQHLKKPLCLPLVKSALVALVRGLVVSPATEKTGAMGCKIKSRLGIGW